MEEFDMKDLTNLDNIVLAHRGIHDNKMIPENSIPAFKRAILKSLPIELDLHVLKDQTVVVFHDDNLKRMTGYDKDIKDTTYEEIKNLKLLKTKEVIPTFSEVLKLVNGQVLLDIEIKNDDNLKRNLPIICKELDSYKGKFMVKSFFPEYVAWLKNNRENFVRGILISNKNCKMWYKVLMNSLLIPIIYKPDFYAYDKTAINYKHVQKLRKKHPVLIWTIRGSKELEKYKGLADGFICEDMKF